MTTIRTVMARVSGLRRRDLERWIVDDWVRPDRQDGDYFFREIDVARVRLIHQLRTDMDIDEAALPVILSLLDQLYDLRRRLREVGEVIVEIAPVELRHGLAQRLLNDRVSLPSR